MKYMSSIGIVLLTIFMFSISPLCSQPITDPQGDVIIGGITPDASSILELRSTTTGFLMPRMTEAERNGIVLPATGLQIYNSDSNTIQYNFGTPRNPKWVSILTDSNFNGDLNSIAWLIDGNIKMIPYDGTTGNFLGTRDTAALVFVTDSAIAMTVDGRNQHLGVGTSPDAAYQVNVEPIIGDNALRIRRRLTLAEDNSPLQVQNEDGTAHVDGTTGDVLVSNGMGSTPRWTDDLQLNSITVDSLNVNEYANITNNVFTVDSSTFNTKTVFNDTGLFNEYTNINGVEFNVDSSTNFYGGVVTVNIDSTVVSNTFVSNDTAYFNGPTYFGDSIFFIAPATFDTLIVNDLLMVDGVSIFNDSVMINGKLTVDSLCVTGPSDFHGNVMFTGDTVLFSDTTNVNIGGNEFFGGDSVVFNTNVAFNDTAVFNEYTNINGVEFNIDSSTNFYGGAVTVNIDSTVVNNTFVSNDTAHFNGVVVFNEVPDILEWVDGDSISAPGTIYAKQALENGTADTVVINDGGSLGVGTVSPQAMVHVQNPNPLGNGVEMILQAPGGSPELDMINDAGRIYRFVVNNGPNGELRFVESGTTYGSLRNGNWGFGVNPASNRVHVSAVANPLRLEGLTEDNTLDSVMVVDVNGVVHWISADSLVNNNGNFWSLTGNTGTVDGTNFLGTTDNVPLNIRVNNQRAFRIEPTGGAPNIIGGSASNGVGAGVQAGTISGGRDDSVTANNASIGGGILNRATATNAVISGGVSNRASGINATVGGGAVNTASGINSTVAGGASNQASNVAATIGGGATHQASGQYATVGGGNTNTASAANATVSGGISNVASEVRATVSGGWNNRALGVSSFIGGGHGNQATMVNSMVTAGSNNSATGQYATIVGGNQNVASGFRSFVGGGNTNMATNTDALVFGGFSNNATGPESVVGGGNSNTASGHGAVIMGGRINRASATDVVIGGGRENLASSQDAVVGGGFRDTASGLRSVVSGGDQNVASGSNAVVAGGSVNRASGLYAVVSGGQHNTSNGQHSIVTGGINNTILNGRWSFIGSGAGDTTTGDYSFIGTGPGNRINGGTTNSILNGHDNFISGNYNTIFGARNDTAQGQYLTILGGQNMKIVGNGSFGFNQDNLGTFPVSITGNGIGYFGNIDVWIGNTDNTAHQLRFYEAQASTGTFPAAGTNYTSFRAGIQTANINYTLPTTLMPTSTIETGVLQTDGSGTLSWINIDSLVNKSGSFWSLAGNTGTTPGTGAGQNYIGTSDAQNLVLATDGTERIHVLGSNGNVGINKTVPAIEELDVTGDILAFSVKRDAAGSRSGLDLIDYPNVVLHGGATNPDPYTGEAGMNIVAPVGGGAPVAIQLRNAGVGYIRYQLINSPTTSTVRHHRFTVPWNAGGHPVGTVKEGVEFGFSGFSGKDGYGIEANFWGARFGAFRESGTNNTGILLRTMSSGNPTERVRVTAGGNVGIGEPAPTHRLYSLNDKTQDEYAAVYAHVDQNTTNQAIGLWGDASNINAANTGTIGVLATGNGNTTVGETNVALQVNDGELTMGRTTEVAGAGVVVEGATGGAAYSSEGPSGVIELTLGAAGDLATAAPTSGTFQNLGSIAINNRYVTSESIVLVNVLHKLDEGTAPNPEDARYMVEVDNRAAGSFSLDVGMIPTATNGTNFQSGDVVRIGYVIVNPSQ